MRGRDEDAHRQKDAEELMMSYVSAEKDRTAREQVMPWFKFLWETYRVVLDVLRNNKKVEAQYAMFAHRAFNFCLTYERKVEFRRLCDLIRLHLNNLNKFKNARPYKKHRQKYHRQD